MNRFFGDNKVEEGHGRRSIRGGLFSVIGRGVMGLAQLGSILFLARLLSPEEYGLVAMVTALTGFAQILVDLGTRDAVVQREHITEGEVSALFWINLAVGCGFSALIAASAPLIAWFYDEPRLVGITLVSSTTFILAALGSQHQALLRRAGMFQELAAVESTSTLISIAITVAMAFAGYGYWALTARSVTLFACIAIGMWSQCRWVPGRPFTRGVKEMIRFGVHLIGYSISDYTGRSGQRVVIGKTLGTTVLGHYQNALQIFDNLHDLMVSSLHSVAISGLSKLVDQRDQFRRSWASALSTVSFYAMPVFGILSVVSQDLVLILLGRKWARAGVLLSIIALRGIPQTLVTTSAWLHVTAGRADRMMRWGWFTTAVQLAMLLVATPFGTMGIAVAYTVSMYLICAPSLSYAGYPLGIRGNEVLTVVWRQVAASLIAAAAGFALRYTLFSDMNSIVRTLLLALAYLAVYGVLAVGMFGVRKPLRVVANLYRDFLPARLKGLAPNGWTPVSEDVPGESPRNGSDEVYSASKE